MSDEERARDIKNKGSPEGPTGVLIKGGGFCEFENIEASGFPRGIVVDDHVHGKFRGLKADLPADQLKIALGSRDETLASAAANLALILGARNQLSNDDLLKLISRFLEADASHIPQERLYKESGLSDWLGNIASLGSIVENVRAWVHLPIVQRIFETFGGAFGG